MSSQSAPPPIERFHAARVREVMHRGLISCPGETPLEDVAGLMAENGIHCVLVDPLEEEARSGRWRVISDLDLVSAAEVLWTTARDISATPTVTVSEADAVSRAATLMREFQVSHLIVVDALANPVGVISTLDVAATISSSRLAAAGDL